VFKSFVHFFFGFTRTRLAGLFALCGFRTGTNGLAWEGFGGCNGSDTEEEGGKKQQQKGHPILQYRLIDFPFYYVLPWHHDQSHVFCLHFRFLYTCSRVSKNVAVAKLAKAIGSG
jgi:hypothetical protein